MGQDYKRCSTFPIVVVCNRFFCVAIRATVNARQGSRFYADNRQLIPFKTHACTIKVQRSTILLSAPLSLFSNNIHEQEAQLEVQPRKTFHIFSTFHRFREFSRSFVLFIVIAPSVTPLQAHPAKNPKLSPILVHHELATRSNEISPCANTSHSRWDNGEAIKTCA